MPDVDEGSVAPRRVTKRVAITLIVVALASLVMSACASAKITVEQPPFSPSPPASVFRAGAAEVDITPPPGAPLWGYATFSAAPAARGYRTRLEARTIVLEGPEGGRVALVQTDLGATSWLLHRKVAERLAPLGIGPDRLMIAAIHTHAGPGGFFGDEFYNLFGAGAPGFDPMILDWLVTKIAESVQTSVARLAPAAVGLATVHAPAASENRSAAAFRRNLCPGCGSVPLPEVDDRLRVLRVDRVVGGHMEPMAAFALFAVHSTAVSEHNDLYHGDVHGYAARYFASLVRRDYRAPTFVAPFANGAEGDVSPTKREQSFAEAERVGFYLGTQAYAAYRSLDGRLTTNVDVTHAYRELVLAGGHTSQGDVCNEGVVGVSTMAGAEDGPSAFRDKFGIYEGHHRKKPQGCQGYKLPAAGFIQRLALRPSALMVAPGSMPIIAPFQVVALHARDATADDDPIAVYATVPGEPTTAVGFAIAERVAGAFGGAALVSTDKVAVVGLANAYLGYFTSTAEYAAQHYEGGSTFFGPLQSLFAAEQLEASAWRVRDEIWVEHEHRTAPDRSSRLLFYKKTVHRPGGENSFFGNKTDCKEHATTWSAGALRRDRRSDGSTERVVFEWTGLDSAHFCAPPRIAIECSDGPLLDAFGQPESDAGVRFEARREGSSQWKATFFPRPEQHPKAGCHFSVDRYGNAPLTSEKFDL